MTGWEMLDTTQVVIGLRHIEMPIIRQNCRNYKLNDKIKINFFDVKGMGLSVGYKF